MAKMNENIRSFKPVNTHFITREDSEDLIIEGYFAVFNSNYEICQGMSESIAPEAFANSLDRDIRALTNHDSTLVLGRTTNGTLKLSVDEKGLYGQIRINPKDSEAVNTYERVKRGDVSQCSIGFEIVKEETEFLDDDSIHWTIREANLWEVSCCTFPAYEDTQIQARTKQADELKRKKLEGWKALMQKRLKEGKDVKNIDDEKKA